eukprot:scaffold1375_cov255-Pinguiococcus_pyrenoidosus.AAC.5
MVSATIDVKDGLVATVAARGRNGDNKSKRLKAFTRVTVAREALLSGESERCASARATSVHLRRIASLNSSAAPRGHPDPQATAPENAPQVWFAERCRAATETVRRPAPRRSHLPAPGKARYSPTRPSAPTDSGCAQLTPRKRRLLPRTPKLSRSWSRIRRCRSPDAPHRTLSDEKRRLAGLRPREVRWAPPARRRAPSAPRPHLPRRPMRGARSARTRRPAHNRSVQHGQTVYSFHRSTLAPPAAFVCGRQSKDPRLNGNLAGSQRNNKRIQMTSR